MYFPLLIVLQHSYKILGTEVPVILISVIGPWPVIACEVARADPGMCSWARWSGCLDFQFDDLGFKGDVR